MRSEWWIIYAAEITEKAQSSPETYFGLKTMFQNDFNMKNAYFSAPAAGKIRKSNPKIGQFRSFSTLGRG